MLIEAAGDIGKFFKSVLAGPGKYEGKTLYKADRI